MLTTLKGILLEYKRGEYQGNAYARAKIRSEEIADNSILTYAVNLKKTDHFDKFLDNEIEFDVEVSRGPNDTAVLKIVKVHS